MNGTTHLREPAACSEQERREFARLVRQGFAGSDDGLPDRIENAHRLAFHYATPDRLAGIAALKSPAPRYRDELFEQAGLPDDPRDYALELGWVYVVRAHRGRQVAESLCRQLLASAPAPRVFATTRPSNAFMIRILVSLGFRRVGKPYSRRNEELVVFLRS